MTLRDIIGRMGLDSVRAGFLRMVLGAWLDAEIELVIGQEEGRVILTVAGREALNMTFGELEGYINGRTEDRSGPTGDGSRLAGCPGVAGTRPD